ncbi:MAG TPA: ABC transporter permease [Candidatus Limnocylindrales bacterium]|nr:ABC transporter permease [Candidatus Limnocylindrales bacterium]
MTASPAPAGRPARHEPLMPNVGYIARREYAALVRGRLFFVSTLVLAGLAMFVAVLPVATKLIDRGSSTTIAVVSSDPDVARNVRGMLASSGSDFEVIEATDEQGTIARVADRDIDAAIVAVRHPSGQLGFSFHLGETMGQSQLGALSLSVFGAAVLDYAARNPVSGFVQPDVQVFRAVGGGAAGGSSERFDASAFASRLIVGAVFGFLIFITIVIYGMWVAQGVVAEKASRVMELLVSAASTRQLVLGKAIGIGLAGATQTTIVLVPALLVLAGEEAIARFVLGEGVGLASSVSSLSPGLLVSFAVFYVLGFALYSLIYAAAGSLVSRPEDLQIIALPLSIVAIAGYAMGLLALTGGITWFIRLASYVPFWSPFVMLTRLSVGRVEPWELVLSVSLLVATIIVVSGIAIRIYGAGVLLYGQRPGFRAYVAAARGR